VVAGEASQGGALRILPLAVNGRRHGTERQGLRPEQQGTVNPYLFLRPGLVAKYTTMKSERGTIQRRCIAWFAATAGAVLVAQGVAKVQSSFGQAELLAVPDPILGLSFGKLVSLVGLTEIAIALLCFSRRVDPGLKIGLVAWMATIFLVYRVGLLWIDWQPPGGRMESPAGGFHLSDLTADRIIKGMLAYLLVGSYGILFWQWWRKRRAKGPPDGDAGGG
jgi:hypothetical protein